MKKINSMGMTYHFHAGFSMNMHWTMYTVKQISSPNATKTTVMLQAYIVSNVLNIDMRVIMFLSFDIYFYLILN